ncbi:MAG: DUF4342 domain-containing protein [Thalassovita sp.]
MTQANSDKQNTWQEEIEISSEALIAKLKELAAEAQVRRVRVIAPDGGISVDIPLSIGAIAGGAVVLAAPALAVIGAVAAFATKVKVEVVREETDPSDAAPATEDAS